MSLAMFEKQNVSKYHRAMLDACLAADHAKLNQAPTDIQAWNVLLWKSQYPLIIAAIATEGNIIRADNSDPMVRGRRYLMRDEMIDLQIIRLAKECCFIPG